MIEATTATASSSTPGAVNVVCGLGTKFVVTADGGPITTTQMCTQGSATPGVQTVFLNGTVLSPISIHRLCVKVLPFSATTPPPPAYSGLYDETMSCRR